MAPPGTIVTLTDVVLELSVGMFQLLLGTRLAVVEVPLATAGRLPIVPICHLGYIPNQS